MTTKIAPKKTKETTKRKALPKGMGVGRTDSME